MSFDLRQGHVLTKLREMPDESVHCVVTSPPYYGLRDYGSEGQTWGDGWHGALGLEPTPEMYVVHMTEVFREVRRVLRDDGTCWMNMGDSYNNTDKRGGGQNTGLKPKDLIGSPWRVAFALQTDGWFLRQDIIWHKPNPMPESVRDRCTKSHEYVFLLTKSARYFYDSAAISEPSTGRASGNKSHKGKTAYEAGDKLMRISVGLCNTVVSDRRNKRSVWTIATQPLPEAHFATFPMQLAETCILAGCPVGGVVLDPFSGAGTTGLAAIRHDCRYIGVDLNPQYAEIARRRVSRHYPLFA